MGGSPPSPPTVIMPPQTAPERYQSLIPQESFQDVAETMNRIEKETAKVQGQRYDEAGTPAQVGARQAKTRVNEAASYLASLPTSTPDTSFKGTPRPFGITSTASSATTQPGQKLSGTGVARSTSTTSTKPKSNLDIVRDMARKQLTDAQKNYADAVDYAKKTPRPTGTITEDPSFANRPDEIFLPTQLGKNV